MKANLARYGLLALNVAVLILIQWGIYGVFIRKTPTDVPVHRVDLKGIGAIWRQKAQVLGPDELTRPIRDAFGVTKEIAAPVETDEPDEGEETAYEGPLQFRGLAFAPEGGRHIVVFEYNGARASYVPGDALPDGKILHSVESVGEGKYVIRFRVKESGKVEQQTYEVERL